MRHGFLLVDKPIGPTSHDVVQMVRKTLNEPKAGHLGTLDPFASGLLVVAVGAKALKVIEFFNHLPKHYIASVMFGATSTTYDITGVIEQIPQKAGWTPPDDSQLQNIIADRFTGKISQVPPSFSAVHIDGERAHVLARQGITPDIPARTIEIMECKVLSYAYPKLDLSIGCSSGTYIRSLAHDLAVLMRTDGYLSALRRTKIGEWDVTDAVAPDKAKWTDVSPLKNVMTSLPSIQVDDAQAAAIALGKKISLELSPDTVAWHKGLPIAIMVPSKDDSQTSHARKVL